jgi:hypothetical protein
MVSKQSKYERLCQEELIAEKKVDRLRRYKTSLLEETAILESREKSYRLALEKILNTEELSNLQEIVRKIAKSYLENKKILQCAAAVAIMRTIGNNPEAMAIFSNPATTQTLASLLLDPGSSGDETELFRLASSNLENLIEFLVTGILERTLNSVGNPSVEQIGTEIDQLLTLHKHSPFLRTLFKN